MAIIKLQAEGINLADTFAFTGTVSGVGGFIPISKTVSTSTVTSVDFDNLIIY